MATIRATTDFRGSPRERSGFLRTEEASFLLDWHPTTTIHKPALRRDSQFGFGHQLREQVTCLENRRRQLLQPLTKAQTLKRTFKSQAEHDASLRICSTPHRQRRTKAQSQDLSRNCQFLEWRHQEQPLRSPCMQNVKSVHGKKGLQQDVQITQCKCFVSRAQAHLTELDVKRPW